MIRFALTNTDLAGGLRALADVIEAEGLPERRRPAEGLHITEFVSAADVLGFAARHRLDVQHLGEAVSTNLTLGTGTSPLSFKARERGAVVLHLVHLPDEEARG